VVVGAGFGGLAVARELRDRAVDVVVVDANNFHTFQPLLYQVATAGLDEDDIAYAVRGIFRRQRNVEFRMGRVTAVDLDARTVCLDGVPEVGGAVIDYDDLVIAAGAVTATFGVQGVEEHALGLKSIDDALNVRAHVLHQFERVAVNPTLIDEGAITFVVVGGGPTGVELAGGLVELMGVLGRDFQSLDVRRARVVLVEAGDRLLPAFAPSLGRHAVETLRRRGVEVILGAGVDRIDEHGAHLAGGFVPAHTVVWTAGITASPLASALAVETTKGGRIVVGPDLSIPAHPEVYVVGDVAAMPDGHGGIAPQLAPAAMQGGRHAARQIVRRIDGQETEPFHYVDKGTMATIGRSAAVAQLPGGIHLWGPVGWLAWLGLHLVMLIGFRNRANVLVNWGWNYFTYDRGARLLSAADIEERNA
jgi:NADH dehydrogenase